VLWFVGALTQVRSRFSGSCRALALSGSSEDIQIDQQRSFAYLSFLDRDMLDSGERAPGTVMRAAMTFDQADLPHGLKPGAAAGTAGEAPTAGTSWRSRIRARMAAFSEVDHP
jgi:hypothetical protein